MIFLSRIFSMTNMESLSSSEFCFCSLFSFNSVSFDMLLGQRAGVASFSCCLQKVPPGEGRFSHPILHMIYYQQMNATECVSPVTICRPGKPLPAVAFAILTPDLTAAQTFLLAWVIIFNTLIYLHPNLLTFTPPSITKTLWHPGNMIKFSLYICLSMTYTRFLAFMWGPLSWKGSLYLVLIHTKTFVNISNKMTFNW